MRTDVNVQSLCCIHYEYSRHIIYTVRRRVMRTISRAVIEQRETTVTVHITIPTDEAEVAPRDGIALWISMARRQTCRRRALIISYLILLTP